MLRPTSYEVLVWEAYRKKTDEYEQKLAGDENLPLAQKMAIADLARQEETDEEDIKRMIDDVCNWLMEDTSWLTRGGKERLDPELKEIMGI